MTKRTFLCAWGCIFLAISCARSGGKKFPELRGAGNVLVLGKSRAPAIEGTTWIFPQKDLPLQEALISVQPTPLLTLMRERKISGIWAQADADNTNRDVTAPLAAFRHIPGLIALALDRDSIFYVGDSFLPVAPENARLLATLARNALRGDDIDVNAFAKNFQLAREEEIAVSIDDGSHPLLWRSARASSLSRAVFIAVRAAKERALEREQTLGPQFLQNIPSMTVRIQRYAHDGRLESWNEEFVNRVITNEHGIGIESKKNWYYRLPWQLARYQSPFEALRQMLQEEEMKIEDIVSGRARLYRFVVQDLVISEPITQY